MGQIASSAAQFKRGGVRLAGVVTDQVFDELFVAKLVYRDGSSGILVGEDIYDVTNTGTV